MIVLSLSSQSLSQQKYLGKQEIDRLTLRTDLSDKEMDNLTWNINRLCLAQQKSSNKLQDTFYWVDVIDSTRKVDWDLIGTGLLKGLEYKRLYQNEVLLTKVLKYEISLWQEKSTNKDLVIERLATELSKQPAFISSHDWKITILITGLTTILTMIFMLQINK